MILLFAIIVPLLAALALILMEDGSKRLRSMVALAGFLVPGLISLLCFFAVVLGDGGYHFLLHSVGENGEPLMRGISVGLGERFGITLFLGVNGISAPLFLLAGLVGAAAGWHATMNAPDRAPHLFLALLLVMQGGLMGVFSSLDVFFFYFFHELALIPTFILIAAWGPFREQRRVAAMQMTIYLTLGAMLSLLGLIGIYAAAGFDPEIGFNLIALREYVAANGLGGMIEEGTLAALLLFGFGILVSLFPFHSWAPRGYANAPTANAMLHAGVLKKFGLYGLVAIAAPLLPAGLEEWRDPLIWLALGNIVIIGVVTLAQNDLKWLLSYSSVMHMGYVFLGIATLTVAGVGGAVMLMFAHGLSVALLFLLAQTIYQRTGTYDLREMGGLGPKAPVLAGLFVAATMASIGLPGFANFWGEFAIFVSLGSMVGDFWDYGLVAAAALGIVISAVYGLRAAAKIFFGERAEPYPRESEGEPIRDLSLTERVPAVVLIVALAGIGLFPSLISQGINRELETYPVLHDALSAPAAHAETAQEETES